MIVKHQKSKSKSYRENQYVTNNFESKQQKCFGKLLFINYIHTECNYSKCSVFIKPIKCLYVSLIIRDDCLCTWWYLSSIPHLMGSSDSSLSYWSRNVLARKKITPEATNRKPATEAIAMPTTSGSDTYSSQCSPRYHQFSPTRHLRWRWQFVTVT